MTLQSLKQTYEQVKAPAETVNSIIQIVKKLQSLQGTLRFELGKISKLITDIDKSTLDQYLTKNELSAITNNIKTLRDCLRNLERLK